MAPRRDLRTLGKAALRRVRGIHLRGDAVRCACCGGSFRRFLRYRGRADAQCPGCGSLERHRSASAAINAMGELGRILHIAPDAILMGQLERSVTLDLRRRADVRGSVEAMPFRSGAFETVVCSHVLEHVADDIAGIAELYRVLAPGGHALILVPVDYSRETTFEDPTITSPRERASAFGQHDHVRVYGRDVRVRLAAVAWEVEELEDGIFTCRR